MTHEKLLGRIDDQDFAYDYLASALRAIVEMHSPSPEGRYEMPICVGCSFSESGYYVLYPCRNIKVIEKELL